MSPFLVLPRVLTKPLRWPADSVRRARHNAYAANAALAVRRAEREEVDRFLLEHRAVEHTVVEHTVVGHSVVGHSLAGHSLVESRMTVPVSEEELRLPQPRSAR